MNLKTKFSAFTLNLEVLFILHGGNISERCVLFLCLNQVQTAKVEMALNG